MMIYQRIIMKYRVKYLTLLFLMFLILAACQSDKATPTKPDPSLLPPTAAETDGLLIEAAPAIDSLATSESAAIIFYNGTILTLESDQPTAQAIAIQGEMITAVGSDDEVLSLRGPETQAIDLQGRTIMPGFVDAHSHLFNDAGSAGMDLDQAQQMALAYGITTFADMFVTPEFLQEMQDYQLAGKRTRL
ncbi:MAG: amidohydrolase family protein [Anaerolineales bacterium]|nr:amidohydrolase family protein [Anaerolineales bacterium]